MIKLFYIVGGVSVANPYFAGRGTASHGLDLALICVPKRGKRVAPPPFGARRGKPTYGSTEGGAERFFPYSSWKEALPKKIKPLSKHAVNLLAKTISATEKLNGKTCRKRNTAEAMKKLQPFCYTPTIKQILPPIKQSLNPFQYQKDIQDNHNHQIIHQDANNE